MDELSDSEMMSMLKFVAACCFESDGDRPPTDAELDAIIDRTRTEDDASVGGLKGGAAHTASSFNDSVLAGDSRELNMRELQGELIGDGGVEGAGKHQHKELDAVAAVDGGHFGARYAEGGGGWAGEARLDRGG